MRRLLSVGLVAAVLTVAGCKEKPKETPKVSKTEAAHLESEAILATQVRDHAQAEGLLARAVELDPDQAIYWLELGAARRRQGNKDGAKEAYKRSLELHQAAYKRDPKDPVELLQQIEMLVLLKRGDEARTVLEKALREHPDNADVKKFAQEKTLDQMLADPALIALSI
jgi:tetratricopeptide (TPR) repeat protein